MTEEDLEEDVSLRVTALDWALNYFDKEKAKPEYIVYAATLFYNFLTNKEIENEL